MRDIYRNLLQDNGVPNWDSYISTSLEKRLQVHYGDRVTFFPRKTHSDFVCSSSLAIGDVLTKVKEFQDESKHLDDEYMTLKSARILRGSVKSCKLSSKQSLDDVLDISTNAAKQLIPDILLKFTCQLLIDNKLEDIDDLDDNIIDKAQRISQQLLYSLDNVRTPLSVGMAFDIYNRTRSKTQITMMNHLDQSISYESFHRVLTSVYNDVINTIQEKCIYIPPNMKHGVFTHFAMDNIDWNEKTTDGSTYHATSYIMIQIPNEGAVDNHGVQEDMELTNPDNAIVLDDVDEPKLISRRRTIDDTCTDHIQTYKLTPGERKKSRSLAGIHELESLATDGSAIGEQLLMLWSLARMTPTRLLNAELDKPLPGYIAFCAEIVKPSKANEIGYLPLRPSSPTNPGVVKTAMTNPVQLAAAIGMTHTIITADQTVYEIAYALCKQLPEEFSNVILMLGGFHLSHNYLKAITKIMRGSGTEDILVESGVMLAGTANKSFGERGDYYQYIHSLLDLNEIMLNLRWEALEDWCIQQNQDTHCISGLSGAIENICKSEIDVDIESVLDDAKVHLEQTQILLDEFVKSNSELATHTLWTTFLNMMKILVCFLHAQREGNWLDYLDQASKMLPYIVAAGHHKYGIYLSLHLQEMKQLHETAPEVYDKFLQGSFTVRRADGRHNGVSPAMVLEQTYKAEVKQKQGLCGITLQPKAQLKWLYTKPIVAATAGKLQRMVHGDHDTECGPHHEAGASRVTRDVEAVQRGMQVVVTKMVNPFKDPPKELVSTSTGIHAAPEVQSDLTQVKQIGEKALRECLEKGGDKLSVKLNYTFDTSHSKNKVMKGGCPFVPEINLLQRVSQVIAGGGEVELQELVGKHECTAIPPSLFDITGDLRQSNKSSLVKVLLDEADVCGLQCLPYVDDNVSAVVIDAMHVVHRWSFRPGETFKDVESRYLHHILSDVPPNTESVHFCCDRYDHVPSLKCIERERRNRPNLKKVYDIQNHLEAPAFRDFVAAHDNKAALLKYLSETWSSSPSRCTLPLYLCGGFSDQTVTMVVDDNRSERVPSLSSTEEEADLRIMMHVLYSASFLGAQRIIVHANDTDVIVLCIYYCAKYPAISELWVRTDIDMFIPIHQIAASLGKEKCMLLPYFHAFSGKDDTSFIYGLGKKKLWKTLTPNLWRRLLSYRTQSLTIFQKSWSHPASN